MLFCSGNSNNGTTASNKSTKNNPTISQSFNQGTTTTNTTLLLQDGETGPKLKSRAGSLNNVLMAAAKASMA